MLGDNSVDAKPFSEPWSAVVGYRYFTCDVFTEVRFRGNPLAVLPDARGLSDAAMQQLAAEFNYSETTFVLPPDDPAHTRKVRIFTPKAEIPFAGHPNVGTAFVLAATGEVSGSEVTFEERAGLVSVGITWDGGRPRRCELAAPQPPEFGDPLPTARVAAALSLAPGAIVSDTHAPRLASVGLPFLCVELVDRAALAGSRVALDVYETLVPTASGAGVLVYTRDVGEAAADLRARMYAPLHGVAEDPATGSAGCALAGLLAASGDARGAWRIAQGIEMGRPSLLHVSAEVAGGTVRTTSVAGASVMVCAGEVEV